MKKQLLKLAIGLLFITGTYLKLDNMMITMLIKVTTYLIGFELMNHIKND